MVRERVPKSSCWGGLVAACAVPRVGAITPLAHYPQRHASAFELFAPRAQIRTPAPGFLGLLLPIDLSVLALWRPACDSAALLLLSYSFQYVK